MSTKHRNAGGPFLVFDPGLGISGSLSVDGTVQGTNDGLQINSDLHVTGTLSASTALSGDLTGNVTGDLTGNVTGNVTGDLTGDVTGNITGNAATTTAFETGRTLKVDLTSTSASTAFDGTAALTDIGVNGSLPIANGGTGATSASAARTNLGLVIGTDVQAQDAELAAIAGLTSQAGKLIEFTGSGTAQVITVTTAGKALLDDTSASSQRSTLGLGSLATQAAIDTTDFTSNSLVTQAEGIASNNNDTSVPTSAAVKSYVDANAGGSSFTYLQEASSPSGNSKILIANNAGTFPSETVKEASLVIKSNTNSGSPGTGGAAIAIHDDGSNAGWQIYYDTSDGNLMFVTDGIATGYQMLDSISGTNTISTSFTGQHRCLPGSGSLNDYRDCVGFIIETTGEYRNFETDSIVDKPSIDQAVPKIKLATSRNSKKVFGIVSGIEENNLRQVHFSMSRQWEIPDSDRRVLVNSIGEGGIWICNINGNLENGDYITSCEIPGLGMKQDDDLLHNYTVAKITCDCNFDLESSIYDCEEFEINGSTYRKAFVGCTYHCG